MLADGDPTRWRLPYPVRILATFVGMPFEAFLGIAVSMSPTPIAPTNTVADTRAAGQTFWILAMLGPGACIAVMAIQWYQQMERQVSRGNRWARVHPAEVPPRHGSRKPGRTPSTGRPRAQDTSAATSAIPFPHARSDGAGRKDAPFMVWSTIGEAMNRSTP